MDAHEKAVDQADTEHLLEARDAFAVCVSATCPRVIREECASELSRLRSRIPTVVFVARNESGEDVTDVTVALGNKSLVRGLTSRAIPLNPGRYAFVLTAADGRTVTESVLLREGEQQRRVEVQFPGAASFEEKGSSVPMGASASPWTAPVVVSAMLGTLGILSFGYFALSGTAVEGCSPNCTGEEVSALRRDYAIADLSLLVGIAGLTTAVLLYESPDGREATAGLQARPEGGLQLQSAWRF